MSGSLPRIYWDANCFIAYIQKEPAHFAAIATARYMRVDQVHSTDPHVRRYNGRYGLAVTEPFTAKTRLPGI